MGAVVVPSGRYLSVAEASERGLALARAERLRALEWADAWVVGIDRRRSEQLGRAIPRVRVKARGVKA